MKICKSFFNVIGIILFIPVFLFILLPISLISLVISPDWVLADYFMFKNKEDLCPKCWSNNLDWASYTHQIICNDCGHGVKV